MELLNNISPILISILKYLFFLIHIFFILVSTIGLIYNWYSMILLFFAIISWNLNNNKCILTQIEDYLFKETIIDIYFKLILKKNKIIKKKRFIVPKYQRYLVIFIFHVSFFYYFIYKNNIFLN